MTKPTRLFPHAHEDIEQAHEKVRTPQTSSPSYRLAYADFDFLSSDELRSARLQLEFLKPEIALTEQGIESTVVVFGSSRIDESGATRKNDAPTEEFRRYYEEARRFGEMASAEGQQNGKREYVIVTGGGPGIMEAANRGATDAGGKSIGLNIVLPREQTPNQYISPELTFQFHYFALRKMHFLLRAKALVVFPGGYGTLDELFEALTLLQTRRIVPIPVLLFGESFWHRIVNFDALVELGMIAAEDLRLFEYVESAEDAWARIKQAPA